MKGQRKMNKLKKILGLLSSFIIAFILCINSFAIDYLFNNTKKIEDIDISQLELYPGGMPFGVKLQTKGLYVVKFIEENSPAKNAGIKLGDIIIKVNNNNIETIEEFSKEIENNAKNSINITVLRNNSELTFNVKPIYFPDEGKYKTGVWVKDSTSGIGTVTFIDPQSNIFGGLGHGICDNSSGNVIKMTRGIVLDAKINGVTKGKIGTAGELKGVFNAKKIGVLTKNTDCGIFGVLSTQATCPENKMKICPINDVKEGEAYIWCTLDENGPKKYSIDISSVDYSNSSLKNFKVRITDKELLAKSGGIVQGMSGSPIIQNGKIVGAVTHVLINDPTQGYGIFIENMLKTLND